MNAILKHWHSFLDEATAVFVAKNTDYDSRFMKALIDYKRSRGIEASRTIWSWEVEKKLDRCRTWITRGELLVKDEGVRNSVIDLFNYTVQWSIFSNSLFQDVDPLQQLTETNFWRVADKFTPVAWLAYLKTEKLIKPQEDDLRALLLEQMTGVPF
ncbi:hypothetical protein [Paenibacillus sp. BK720]|uniref:hypothetical protein n=1 Tax=Paenibacillus sp. BK720 TaxID=2587092 RepID=UPI00141DA70E|nr:hypothetical protein [Paenibacillus sp. BK720]NIK67910.1 hypothetical protein [Paenibacillus sp. BK720]